jgi:hypothetical protein
MPSSNLDAFYEQQVSRLINYLRDSAAVRLRSPPARETASPLEQHD